MDYKEHHPEFPPQSPRPRGILFITDRTMDLVTPLIHEFTFQSMVHDLLPIRGTERDVGPRKQTKEVDNSEDRAFYTLNEDSANEERKVMELSEKDKIWVDSRHLSMELLLGKLGKDLEKFREDHPQFEEK